MADVMCSACGQANRAGAKFCNECGGKLSHNRAETDGRGRAKLHFDLVHPIRSEVRDYVHKAILDAYEKEAANRRNGIISDDE
jgi:stage V sporulation protein G